MVALRPCPGCARHARVSEPACPFCGARLGEAFRTFVPPRAPTTRLTRAALAALGAGGVVVACGSGSVTREEPVDGGGALSMPEDGGSTPDSSAASASDASTDADAGATGFFYAAPEAGRVQFSPYSRDGGADAACLNMVCPIYGIGLNCICFE
jgi:hypothetical protein